MNGKGWLECRVLSASCAANGSWRKIPGLWISPSWRFGILQDSRASLIRAHTEKEIMWYYLSCKPAFLPSISALPLSTRGRHSYLTFPPSPALDILMGSQPALCLMALLPACDRLSSSPACLSHLELVDSSPSQGSWGINSSRKISACFPHLKLIQTLWAKAHQRPLSRGSTSLRRWLVSQPLAKSIHVVTALSNQPRQGI